MVFLNQISFFLGGDNGNLCKLSDFAAVPASKSHGVQTLGIGDHHGCSDIFSIAGGADAHQQITGLSVGIDLLSIYQISVHIVGKGGNRSAVRAQRNCGKTMLQLSADFCAKFAVNRQLVLEFLIERTLQQEARQQLTGNVITVSTAAAIAAKQNLTTVAKNGGPKSSRFQNFAADAGKIRMAVKKGVYKILGSFLHGETSCFIS